MKDTKDKDNKPHRHVFQVQTTPKGIFPLFSKASDAYLYEKKFYLDLPQQIIPPKSFRYPFSLENFCKTDLLTMTFELKKTNELLLTDPKLNTPIHRDFINNSLELIFEGITPQNKDPALKRRILEIIERNDDISKSKKTQPISKSFYLRNSTYLPGSLNIYAPDKYRYQNESKTTSKANANKTQNASQIKTQIDKTFEDIKLITKGYENKLKKGITVKNVYNVFPLDKYPNTDVCEYIFPIDPNMEIDINENIQLPQKFLLYHNTINKAEDESDVLSLFKHEKMKTNSYAMNGNNNSNCNSNDSSDVNINIAEFYSHEKDYIYSSAHEYELFNRSLIFLDKEKESAFFIPVKDKITLKKYKKAIKESNDDDNDDRNYLGNKHERDIVIEPEEIDKEGEKRRNAWLRENGFNYKVECVPIMEVNYDEVKKIKKEKKKGEDMNMMDNDKEDNEDNIGLADEEEESEEDELIEHHKEGSDIESEVSKDKDHEQKANNDDDDDEEENENDALFSEDEDELNVEQRNNTKHNDNKLIED